ncbi:hypothetical protein SAMN06295949_10870 [Pseudomonas delhiensis]|uniref:Uncharacterized protein n=1 Tax=Pseudomonas delhiensis TaxID=366289 RepID=A0ABY1SSR7_9PSED|nr:hypothetical protein SAMN06295949_10870 [Pseudomonas delhiensis]
MSAREMPCLTANCRSGPCPRFARRARSYIGMAWVGGVGTDPIRETRRYVRLSWTRSAPTGRLRALPQTVGAGPARDSRAGRAPTLEWRGWGGVGADPIRETRRYVRLSRTRSAPTGRLRALPQTVGAGPARDSRAGRAPTLEWRGWGGRHGSYPRNAPIRPAIVDKVRSYKRRALPQGNACSASGRFCRPIWLRKLSMSIRVHSSCSLPWRLNTHRAMPGMLTTLSLAG